MTRSFWIHLRLVAQLAAAATLCMAQPDLAQAAPTAAEFTTASAEMTSTADRYVASASADEDVPAADDLAAQMFLEVSNPSSGDTIRVGRYLMEGIAFDRAADQGAGIESVTIFLEDRDLGGLLIGTGQMGAASPVPDDPLLSGAGWNAEVTIPRNMTGPHTLFVYTLSSATGGELVVGTPVVVAP